MEHAYDSLATLQPRNTRADVSALLDGMQYMPNALHMMGFNGIRKGQDTVAMSIMSGKDTLCVLPTGGGKTACFVLPTLAKRWRTLVFSPLQALMRDQVQGLWAKNISAGAVSGNQTAGENSSVMEQWSQGKLQVMYCAPERLNNEIFMSALRQCPPDFVVIDEAHVISSWSDNFRPEYVHIGHFVHQFQPKVVAAFTATCPASVEEDIRRVLLMQSADKILYYPRRKNLKLFSERLPDRPHDMPAEAFNDDLKVLTDKLHSLPPGSKIVYCATIKQVNRVVDWFNDHLRLSFTAYNGEMNQSFKRDNQDAFMRGDAEVIVTTNAFGMGIDKPDVRAVIEFDIPSSLEALAQELGRAGRDGKDSLCLTYFSEASRRVQMFFFRNGHPNEQQIRKLYTLYKSRQMSDGYVYLTNREAADLLNWGPSGEMIVSSVKSILRGCKVLQDASDAVKPCKVSFKNSNDDKRFAKYRDIIKELASPVNDVYVFNLDTLAMRLDVQKPTVSSALRSFHSNGWLNYDPPFRGKPIHITGPLDAVDFDRLIQKEADDLAKFNELLSYETVADERKHEFLEAYFGVPPEIAADTVKPLVTAA